MGGHIHTDFLILYYISLKMTYISTLAWQQLHNICYPHVKIACVYLWYASSVATFIADHFASFYVLCNIKVKIGKHRC